MAERIGWDKYEAALLIDACERVSRGASRQEVVNDLSLKLRKRAILHGNNIDDIFRNRNGIYLQMSKMDYLLTDGEIGLPGSSKFFMEMVTLKRTYPMEFEKILREAKRQIGEERDGNVKVSDMRAEFIEWINKQGKLKVHPNVIISVLDDSSEYAQKHGVSRTRFWNMEDSTTFVSVCRKLSGNKLFRVFKRSTAQTLDKVYCYYRDFLDSRTAVETADTESAADDIPQVSKPAIDSDESVRAKNPELYDKVYAELKRLSKEKAWGASALEIYEYSGGSLPEIKAILERVTWAKAYGNQYRFSDASDNTTEGSLTVSAESAAELSKQDVSASGEHTGSLINGKTAIIHKKVDKSLLRDGLTVPKAVAGELMHQLGVALNKGEACDITVFINGDSYQAKLTSVNFSEKYSDIEVLQIRYSMSSPICRRINEIFNDDFKNGVDAYMDIYVVGENQLEFVCPQNTGAQKTEGSVAFFAKPMITDTGHSRPSNDIEKGFISWMQGKGMAESTVSGYSSAIRSAEAYAKRSGIEGVKLTSNDTSVILRSIDKLLSSKNFFEYNKEQHNRFFAAFRKLRDYIAELNRKNGQQSNEVAMEKLYPDLYRKLCCISKIYGDPQGLTLDRIVSIIGIKGDTLLKNNIVEILDGVSWATKISDGVYSFSKKGVVQPPVAEIAKTENATVNGARVNDFDKDAFISVLMNRYQSGMQFDSIDLENFRDTYADMYGEKLGFNDEELEERLKYCGILYNDRLFPAEGVIDSSAKERLFTYIENNFAAGKKVLYYKAIYSDLADAFEYCFSLTDEKMLKEYIEYTAEKGKYYFQSDYMSIEKGVKVDHSEEIADYMLAAGKPLSYDELYEGLSHISKDVVHREIRTNSKFIMNGKENYFHIDIFEFSQSDREKTAEILSNEIADNGYAIWSRVFESIQEKMPIFIENNLYLSSLGIRNALSVFMSDMFCFEGEVISANDAHLDMAGVYRLFAKHHVPFTDNDIYEFSKEVGCPIYFFALADESVRVSRHLFVAKDRIEFDVEATDKALETYLSSGYILVKDVDSFLLFPNVGYEWNEFLLESYLMHYSEKFCLVNNGISLNNVAGAIADKGGNFTQFVDVCAQALADSGIELKETAALNYLAEINLITRKSYREIDIAMTKARQIRNRRG